MDLLALLELLRGLKEPKAWLGLAVVYGMTFILNLLLANRSRIDAWAEANPKRGAVYKALRGVGLDPWHLLAAGSLALKKKLPTLPEAPKSSRPPTLTLLAICLLLLFGCGTGSKQAAASAADVVNAVARNGDQAYQLSVDACHAAEKVAVEHPDLNEAKRLVVAIRARCDIAFAASEQLRGAIERVDALAKRLELGQATVKEVVDAALVARRAFDQTEELHRALATYLKDPK